MVTITVLNLLYFLIYPGAWGTQTFSACQSFSVVTCGK
jgi:hypothetical protein